MPVTYSTAECLPDIGAATYEALRDRFKQLATVQDMLGSERKALWDEISRREKEVAIKLRLGVLSDAEKVLYKAVLDSPSFNRG